MLFALKLSLLCFCFHLPRFCACQFIVKLGALLFRYFCKQHGGRLCFFLIVSETLCLLIGKFSEVLLVLFPISFLQIMCLPCFSNFEWCIRVFLFNLNKGIEWKVWACLVPYASINFKQFMLIPYYERKKALGYTVFPFCLLHVHIIFYWLP